MSQDELRLHNGEDGLVNRPADIGQISRAGAAALSGLL
jgi:hypothetical protein